MKLPLGKIADFIRAQGTFNPGAFAAGYSIDSRTIRPGELFFAVKGERLDGHDFVPAALAAGAVGAVISRERANSYPEIHKLLAVDDPLNALQTLATAVRKLWGRRVIAVTGSAGKTTTKDSIATLLSTQFRVLKSEGNLNNHFGLPLQLLRLEPEHELAVMELGMSHSGEIAALARIAQPEMGVVTCVAPVHLGFFESVAEIARAKYELIEGLPPRGTAILNTDDDYVSQFGRDFPGKVITFGIRHPADVRADTIQHRGPEGSTFEIVVGDRRVPARLPLIGEHNIYNALAAVAVAIECGTAPEVAAAALALLAPTDKRGQVVQVGGATVINDCYNSNPKALDSMVDALVAMAAPAGGSRIVVAGEMLELGPTADDLHRRCGRHLAELGVDVLIGVRGAARHMVDAARQGGTRAEYLETPEEAGEWLAREVRPGDLVLLKASRGVRLERALEAWMNRLEPAGRAEASSRRG